VSPYGVTKLAAEHLCTLYARNHGVPTVSLRFFTVYGPRQRPDMAFTRFCRAVSDGREIEVYGTGEQVRDFTYVDDVVEANLQVGTADVGSVPAGSVFNVAGGSSTTVNEVLALLGEISGRAVRVVRGAPVLGDVLRTGGSTEALSKATGWMPRVGLREGLEEQYRWAAGSRRVADRPAVSRRGPDCAHPLSCRPRGVGEGRLTPSARCSLAADPFSPWGPGDRSRQRDAHRLGLWRWRRADGRGSLHRTSEAGLHGRPRALAPDRSAARAAAVPGLAPGRTGCAGCLRPRCGCAREHDAEQRRLDGLQHVQAAATCSSAVLPYCTAG
jgi:hypothetical protein